MKITRQQTATMRKAARREIQIAEGMNINKNREFKCKKDYNRKLKHRKKDIDSLA
jgi:hypothetical protein